MAGKSIVIVLSYLFENSLPLSIYLFTHYNLFFMKKWSWKRIALTVSAVFVFLVVVLMVHIYVVTRPHIDASTRIMARLDIHQPIVRADADRITAWLYQQKGVDHVLVNPQSAIAIFSYAPVLNDANRIAQAFKASLPYSKAERIMPPQGTTSGCPVAATSITYKVYTFMKRFI